MTKAFLTRDLIGKRDELAALCRRHGVASLDLFGSGTRDDWDMVESDLDFVVSFRDGESRGLEDRYLALAEDLESLFGRRVDLMTEASIRNPYFREAVDATRVTLYEE
jgi:predicted nucleotidyltransferase